MNVLIRTFQIKHSHFDKYSFDFILFRSDLPNELAPSVMLVLISSMSFNIQIAISLNEGFSSDILCAPLLNEEKPLTSFCENVQDLTYSVNKRCDLPLAIETASHLNAVFCFIH